MKTLLQGSELGADVFELLQRGTDDVERRIGPGMVLTLTPARDDSDEAVLRPISDAVADKAKAWFDCAVTRPWTVADVVPPAASVTAAVPPAFSVPVPANPVIEMLSPCAWVSTSWPPELTAAVTPVVPVC